MDAGKENRLVTALGLILVAVTVLIYTPVWENKFIVLDDSDYIVENPHVRSGLTADGIYWAFTTGYGGNWHPLTWISHMVDIQLFGLEPGPHHLVNVVLHSLNALLLFLVMRSATGALWPSFFVAALFAWHPAHVESVAWAAERKDTLSTLFWILTLQAYIRFARTGSRGDYGRTALFLGLGLLCKPMLVTLPFVLLLLDYWPLGRLQLAVPAKRDRRFLNRIMDTLRASQDAIVERVREKAPFFLLILISSFITLRAQRSVGAMAPMEDYGVGLRLANVAVSYARYVGEFIWPADLSVFYPLPDRWPWYSVAVSLALVGALTWAALRETRRRPWVVVGWFWFVGTLVPVIGLVQVGSQSMADRYTYITHTGLAMIVAWFAAEIIRTRSGARGPLLTWTVIALVAGALATRVQAGYWRNTGTLMNHAIKVTGRNAFAHLNLAYANAAVGGVDDAIRHYRIALTINPNHADIPFRVALGWANENRLKDAIQLYTVVLERVPDHIEARYNLGNALLKMGKWDEGVAQYILVLRQKPDFADAHNNLGFALASKQRYPEALLEYNKAIQINTNYADAYNNLAVALDNMDRPEDAAANYAMALKIKPGSAATHDNLAMTLLKLGDAGAAHRNLLEAIRLAPADAKFQYHMGLVLGAQGKLDEAIDRFRAALRLQPDWPGALTTLAWLFATHPDPRYRNGAEAVKLASRACELTSNREAKHLDTLAAALAEAGRFDEAINTARMARESAAAAGQTPLAEAIEKRIVLFQSRKPFRDGQ
jgi:tetratricopeptide (TPR) repeat protein